MKRKNIPQLTTELILSDHRTCHALHRQTVTDISTRRRRLSQFPPRKRPRSFDQEEKAESSKHKTRTANQHINGKEGLSR